MTWMPGLRLAEPFCHLAAGIVGYQCAAACAPGWVPNCPPNFSCPLWDERFAWSWASLSVAVSFMAFAIVTAVTLTRDRRDAWPVLGWMPCVVRLQLSVSTFTFGLWMAFAVDIA